MQVEPECLNLEYMQLDTSPGQWRDSIGRRGVSDEGDFIARALNDLGAQGWEAVELSTLDARAKMGRNGLWFHLLLNRQKEHGWFVIPWEYLQLEYMQLGTSPGQWRDSSGRRGVADFDQASTDLRDQGWETVGVSERDTQAEMGRTGVWRLLLAKRKNL